MSTRSALARPLASSVPPAHCLTAAACVPVALAVTLSMADPHAEFLCLFVSLLLSGAVLAWLGASLAVWLLFELDVAITLAAGGLMLTGVTSSSIWSSLSARREPHRPGAWVLWGDDTLVVALGRVLRRAGVSVIELPSRHTGFDPADPRCATAEAMLCASTSMLQNVWAACRWSLNNPGRACFRWATLEPSEGHGDIRSAELPRGAKRPTTNHAGRAVWSSSVAASRVADELHSGRQCIEVIEATALCRHEHAPPRACPPTGLNDELQPLFWIDDGRAHIIVDPRRPGPPRGALAVVLRRRACGYRVLGSASPDDHSSVIPRTIAP